MHIVAIMPLILLEEDYSECHTIYIDKCHTICSDKCHTSNNSSRVINTHLP